MLFRWPELADVRSLLQRKFSLSRLQHAKRAPMMGVYNVSSLYLSRFTALEDGMVLITFLLESFHRFYRCSPLKMAWFLSLFFLIF